MRTTTDHAPSAAAQAGITHVFVLMLENHSFDNVFAMSGIEGITTATTATSNCWIPPGHDTPRTVSVTGNAPWSMTTDPGHEFEDVLEQLCSVRPCACPELSASCLPPRPCYAGGPYPAIDLSGFASNYATSTSEGTGTPDIDRVGDIMSCYDTAADLPVLLRLATEFAICDAWFSSLPGPTWPNRFFVHGASSAGVAQSPHAPQEVLWETIHGFAFEHGTIYDALHDAGHEWRIYQDIHNDFSDDPSKWHQGGWISQAASLKGIHLHDIRDVRGLRDDLHAVDDTGQPTYPAPYTFIEPNYGASFMAPQDHDLDGPTYKGGSAQHPEDDPSGGEGLVRSVYEAIRSSPLWPTSMLVVVYDEHGGFHDSVIPGPAVAPGDAVPRSHQKLNEYGFDFTQYGVRVPAVVVSPRIPRGTVDHTTYDHTSVLATVERLLGLGPLTERDAAANDLFGLLTLDTPRRDCPEILPPPAARPPRPAGPPVQANADAVAGSDGGHPDRLVPGHSNAAGFLQVLLKAELALADDHEHAHRDIVESFRAMTTMDHAVDYVRSVGAKVKDARPAQPR